MTSPLEWPNVTVPDDHWEESGDTDETSRLTAALLINNVPVHLEARAVTIDEESGLQSAVGDWPEDFDFLAQIAEPDGPFYTWTINGRDYVVIAYPFCQ